MLLGMKFPLCVFLKKNKKTNPSILPFLNMQVWIPHKPISYLEWKGHFKVENIKESFDWRSHKTVHTTYLRLTSVPMLKRQ